MTDHASAASRGVVTPEAVRLEFSTAGIGTRALAKIIDYLIQFVVLLVMIFALTLVSVPGAGLPMWAAISALLFIAFLLTFGYPALFETVMRGRTPGKAALGLRVVTREGAPIQFRHAAIRSALGLLEFMVTGGATAVVSSLLSKQQQRLGDHVAGTIVLRERESLRDTSPVRFTVPPGARPYAATLDPAVLNPQEYQAVRTYLLRSSTFPTDARAALSQQLAHPLAVRLGHRPPAGVTPEQFLLSLAVRYQERGATASASASGNGPTGGPPSAAPGQDFGGLSAPQTPPRTVNQSQSQPGSPDVPPPPPA